MSTENKPTPALYAGGDPLDLDETVGRLTITLDGLAMLYNEVSTWFNKDMNPDAFSAASRWASVIFLLDDSFSRIRDDLSRLVDESIKNRKAGQMYSPESCLAASDNTQHKGA